MAETTIIYYTDNSLEETFAQKIRDYLVKAAEGKPIICVSQKQMDFGKNIWVGELPRCHHSLFYEILRGIEATETKYVALAEHDCLYTAEHFNWIPKDDGIFWYNLNHWFADWNSKREGQYSYFRRKALSQLICERNLMLAATKEKLQYLEDGFTIQRGVAGACEFGAVNNTQAFNAEPGVVEGRQSYKDAVATLKAQGKSLNLWVGKDLGKGDNWKAKGFRTKLPNIDIRHGSNFTGRRRGKLKAYTIPYWGSFHKVMDKLPPGKWYQEATINGVKMRTFRRRDTNEGRWNNLIKPLIVEGDAFLELGCNAGFYLRKAKDMGFRKAIGMEKDANYLRHAAYWESCEPKGIEVIAGAISPNFNWDEIPMVDTCLLANFHYWLTDEELKDCIGKLWNKTVYCLVIGRGNHITHTSKADKDTLLENFKRWKVVAERKYDKFYSVLFKSDLDSYNVDSLYKLQQLTRSRKYEKAFTALIRDVMEGRKIIPAPTLFYEYTQWRQRRWPAPKIEAYVEGWIKLIKEITAKGLNRPLLCNLNNHILDGDHRIMIAKQMGWKNVIVRKIQTTLEAREWLRQGGKISAEINTY